MKRSLRVLIVEDSDDDCALLLRELSRDYEIVHRRVQTAEEMSAALAAEAWDLVVADYALPRFSALAALGVLEQSEIDVPFIIVSGTIGEDTAVEALKAGASDFMLKDRLARLRPAVERELREVGARRRQREAERAQRSVEAHFRAIMEAVTEGVVSADRGGRIIYVNPAAERMFGYSAAALLGEPLTLLVPERRQDAHGALARYLWSADKRTVELVGRRQDGSEFPVEVSVGIWTSNGSDYLAGIIRDISERKEVEAQLLVADRMISVGTLAAGVAHEINNPLAAVIANLDMSVRDVAELRGHAEIASIVEGLYEQLNDARTAAGRVRTIVKDLKLFSRVEAEPPGPVDVERVMESTLRMAWNEIRHRARLVKDYARVPLVQASESRLGQVFMNIVVNAAQAMCEGQVERNVLRIVTRSEASSVIVEISDTGSGIPPEVMRRLFTPFVTTKPAGMGTGLGLSICHRIVTDLGGKIEAESKLGEGTLFRVSLPRARTDVEQPKPPALSAQRTARRGRVLAIDDEPIVVRAIQRALAREHDVLTVNDAREALRLIASGESFDVVLCDLMMPELSGMDFHAELSKLAPEQAKALIFLTGGAVTPRAREFLDAVANQRVEKPFDALHLRALINDRVD